MTDQEYKRLLSKVQSTGAEVHAIFVWLSLIPMVAIGLFLGWLGYQIIQLIMVPLGPIIWGY